LLAVSLTGTRNSKSISATPLYEQAASILRARIESGDIRTRLPSVRTITEEYGVSHVTAEHAIALLRHEGLVVTVIGVDADGQGVMSVGRAKRLPGDMNVLRP
jgi:DNA-binding transcriptional MocR family regulator